MDRLTTEELQKLRVLLDTWEYVMVMVKFFSAFGKLIKWVASILIALSILWAAFKTGNFLGKPL